MKKTLMLIYAVCAMIIISGCLLWFVFMLRADSLTGKIESMNVFKTFTRQASEIIRNAQYDENTDIQPILEQLCRNNSTVIPAVLIRTGTQKVFVWPENTPYFPLGSNSGTQQKSLPLFCMRAQTAIPATAYSESVSVQSVLQTVPISTLLNRGQTVFFIVLTVSLFTLVLLIFSYLDFSRDDADAELRNSFSTGENPEDIPAQTENTGLEIPPLSVEEYQKPHEDSSMSLTEQIESLNRLHICDRDCGSEPPAEHIGTDASRTAAGKQDSTAAEDDMPVYKPAAAPDETTSPAVDDAIPDAVQNTLPDSSCIDNEFNSENICYTPQSDNIPVSSTALFAEKTPIPEQAPMQAEEYGSFENSLKSSSIEKHNELPHNSIQKHESQTAGQYHLQLHCNTAMPTGFYAKMIEDLQAAIRETAVAGEDLTLLFIYMPDIMHNESIVQSVRMGLDRINKFFFFDEDTIGLILYYTTLDTAMHIAVKLYEDIASLLLFSDSELPIGIGITTRAGRLIPAHRMVEEAAAAIRKTAEPDSDPIVAFRVNPEKYRSCLAQMAENTAK